MAGKNLVCDKQLNLFQSQGVSIQQLPQNRKVEIVVILKKFIIDVWHRNDKTGAIKNG